MNVVKRALKYMDTFRYFCVRFTLQINHTDVIADASFGKANNLSCLPVLSEKKFHGPISIYESFIITKAVCIKSAMHSLGVWTS